MNPNKKPATFSQKNYLLKLGYVGAVPLAELSVREASAAIQQLRIENGQWRYSHGAKVRVRTGRFRR